MRTSTDKPDTTQMLQPGRRIEWVANWLKMSLDQSGNSLVRTRNENQHVRRVNKEYAKELLSLLNQFQKKSEV